MRFVPHDYQVFAMNRILDTKRIALFLDMGLGKTVTTLTAIDELMYDRFDVSKVLVIAPLRVADATWGAEAKKWDHLKHLRVERVLGSERERTAALKRRADVYCINRENVEWLVAYYRHTFPFDVVVIDELSSFKSPTSKRFRALRKVIGAAKRVIGLTGTPSPNSLLDIWSQMYLIDQGERLGRTMTAYRDRYFTPGRRNGHIVYRYDVLPGSEERIYAAISDVAVSMKSADYLDMPERIDNFVPVKLNQLTLEGYRRFERDLLLTEEVTAANAAVLSNKLLQYANGAIYDDHGAVLTLHDEKLDVLADLIESAQGKPMLLFYAYQHDAQRIQERFDVVELKTTKHIDDFNAGRIPVLMAHPAAAGHGLNLQAGGSMIVWFGLTWSLELYQQANARLHRQGQMYTVIVHHLVAEGTVDEDVIQALSSKAVNQDALLEAIKARVRCME